MTAGEIMDWLSKMPRSRKVMKFNDKGFIVKVKNITLEKFVDNTDPKIFIKGSEEIVVILD